MFKVKEDRATLIAPAAPTIIEEQTKGHPAMIDPNHFRKTLPLSPAADLWVQAFESVAAYGEPLTVSAKLDAVFADHPEVVERWIQLLREDNRPSDDATSPAVPDDAMEQAIKRICKRGFESTVAGEPADQAQELLRRILFDADAMDRLNFDIVHSRAAVWRKRGDAAGTRHTRGNGAVRRRKPTNDAELDRP